MRQPQYYHGLCPASSIKAVKDNHCSLAPDESDVVEGLVSAWRKPPASAKCQQQAL
jgi:hypothetical protein